MSRLTIFVIHYLYLHMLGSNRSVEIYQVTLSMCVGGLSRIIVFDEQINCDYLFIFI